MRIIITILLVVNYALTFGQLNLPLKFQNNEAKWAELNWIEGNRKEDQVFKNRLPPIVIEDTIYTFLNYHGKNDNGVSLDFCGYLIKKLNKNTGEKYWEVLRIYKDGKKRKAISQPSFELGKLTVSLYDEVLSRNVEWTCYPAHIVIDTNTGLVIDSNYVDRTDRTLPTFRRISTAYPNGSRFYVTKTGYTYRGTTAHGGGSLGPLRSFIRDQHLGFDGHFISADTFELTSQYKTIRLNDWFENNEGGLNILRVSSSIDWTDREFKFMKLDKNLNLLKSVDLTQYFKSTDSIAAMGVENLYQNDGLFVVTSQYESFANREYYFHYHLFDSDGNFLDRLDYTLRDGIDNANIEYGWLRPMADVVNKRILLTHSRQNKMSESTFFELFASDGDTIKRVKRIEVEGSSDHFRTDMPLMMANGDILLYVAQFEWRKPGPFFSWIMLDGAKMGIVSSTDEVESVRQPFVLYPNPTSSNIHILTDIEYDHVMIQSIDGAITKQETVRDGAVNVSSLPNGTYICTLIKGSRTISSGVKFVKMGK